MSTRIVKYESRVAKSNPNEYLQLIRKVDICKLNECIVTERTGNNERCFLTRLYRSPNQNEVSFEFFL